MLFNNFYNSDFFYYLRLFFVFVREILFGFWWLIIFLILGKIFFDLRKRYLEKQRRKKEEIKEWVTLAVKINREILQTPKAMEQVFAGLHSLKDSSVSLEIFGQKKEVYFIARLPKRYKKIFESQIYAQYPELEIKEIEDYLAIFPPNLPNKFFDLWGGEIIFENQGCFPVQTYQFFEAAREEKRIDPLANLIEGISHLQEKEWLALQIIIKPLDSKKWVESGKKEIDKMLGKKEPAKITWQDWTSAFFKNLAFSIFTPPVWPEEKKEEKSASSSVFSSGSKEIIEKIEQKISKLGFEATIRYLYIASPEVYDEINSLSVAAYFNQFNIKNLNSFRINENSLPEVKSKLFNKKRTFLKKIDFYQNFLSRQPGKETIILNTEELATIYHFPALKVKAPALIRILSKKGEPPTDLPI